MPATYEQIYDFESAIEGAFAGIIATAMGPAVKNVLTSRSDESEQTPRVEIYLSVGNALNQRYRIGSPVREVPNAFTGTLTARLVTTRPINATAHGPLRGRLRYCLSAGKNAVNSTNLPYHQVMEMLPASSSPQIIDEKQQDVSVLQYSIWFAINNEAWPT